MNRDEFRMTLGFCLISGIAGGVITLMTVPTMVRAANSNQIFRAREIRIIGQDGVEQIVLKASKSGPLISLMDSDKKQEIRLEIKANEGAIPNVSAISFHNLKEKKALAYISTKSDNSATIGMGHPSYPDYVQLSTTHQGRAAGASLCLGFPSTPYVQAMATESEAVLDVSNGPTKLSLYNSENQPPALSREDRVQKKKEQVIFVGNCHP